MDDLVVPPLLCMEEFLHQLDNSIGNYKAWKNTVNHGIIMGQATVFNWWKPDFATIHSQDFAPIRIHDRMISRSESRPGSADPKGSCHRWVPTSAERKVTMFKIFKSMVLSKWLKEGGYVVTSHFQLVIFLHHIHPTGCEIARVVAHFIMKKWQPSQGFWLL